MATKNTHFQKEVILTKRTINKILYDTRRATIVALDKDYNPENPRRRGRRCTLYHSNPTGFFITVETTNKGQKNYIEPVDELAAKEHYKHCQQRTTSFPNN